MEPWQIALIIKPFAIVLIIWLFLAPIRRLFQKHMKDSKLKRLLLRRLD